jgi:hypothetical protein
VQEAFENKVIGYNAYSVLHDKCRCGNSLELSDSLKRVRCSNDKCINNILNRAEAFCVYNNIELNKDGLLNIIEKLSIISPFQLLELNVAYDNKIITSADVYNILDVLDTIQDIRSADFELYQLFEMCGDSNISTIAKSLVYGYDSVAELYEELKRAQISYINERLGVVSSEACSLTYEIYTALDKMHEEMIYAESLVNVVKYTDKLYIAFNDNTGTFLNKSELLSYMQEKFKYTFVHTETVSEKTDILIKHINTVNSKYKSARLINDRYTAEKVNSGQIDIDDIGIFESNKLKPIGSKVYIDSLDNVLNRLRMLG